MAADLTASLVLKLQDDLSGGLRKLTEQLEQLRGVAETIQMKGLNEAADQAGSLNGQLGKTEGLLSRVSQGFSALGRVAQEAVGGLRTGLANVQHRITAFQEASSNLINRGFGAAAEGFAVIEPMKKYAEYENIVRHIGITEGLSGAALEARIKKLEEFFRQDALRTGQSSESVAQAYQDLTQMGIHEDLDKIIQAHSRAATAYNTTAEALGPAVGALIQTLKIPADDLAATMSAMAQASKEGRFKIEDFSRELPGVAAQMALMGMTGRKAADTAFASLEIVMRGSSNPSQAATDLSHFFRYVRTPFAARHFKKAGMDLHDILEKGVQSGDLIGTMMDAINKHVKGGDRVKFFEEFGKMFHDQGAGDAMAVLYQQRADWEAMRAKLNKVDSGQVERDFISGFDAPVVQMRIMSELIEQITERFGEGFLPVLKQVNFALWYINAGLKWATEHYPKLTAVVLGGMAALLALGAVLGLIGAIFPVIATGAGLVASAFGLLFSPITAVLALFAAVGMAAYDIYAHWDRFEGYFEDMWNGIKAVFRGFVVFVTSVFTGDLSAALSGLTMIKDGVVRVFTGIWDAVKQVFTDFVAWVDTWTEGLASKIVKAVEDVRKKIDPETMQKATLMNRGVVPDMFDALNDKVAQKTAPPAPSNDNAPAPAPGRVDIHVHADPGTAVTQTQSSGPVNVQTPPPASSSTAPQRGATVGRP